METTGLVVQRRRLKSSLRCFVAILINMLLGYRKHGPVLIPERCSACKVQKVLLYQALCSCNIDIQRYINFHQEGTGHPLSVEKLAAFHVKWLNKMQPIQWLARHESVTSAAIPDERTRKGLLRLGTSINQRFCVWVVQEFLGVVFSQDIRKSLRYALRYRPLDESGLILLFQEIKNHSKVQSEQGSQNA